MRYTPLVVVLSAALSACHAVQPSPTSPAPTDTRPNVVPTRLVVNAGPAELPIGGGTVVLWIEASDGSRTAPNVTVTLETTDGVVESSQLVTDNTGHATVPWTLSRTATVTARTGDIVTTQTVKVATPLAPLPPSQPPPAPPPAAPAPVPPPPVPGLTVTLTPASGAVPAGVAQNYTAATTNLDAGETVVAYQWTFEDGATATTTVPTRSFTYATHGIKAPKVVALSSTGRTGTGTGSVVVTSPLR